MVRKRMPKDTSEIIDVTCDKSMYDETLRIVWRDTAYYRDKQGEIQSLESNALGSVQLNIGDPKFMLSFVTTILEELKKRTK